MTASCPSCGGKWDIENEHYSVLLRCGDEHDIKCGYCKEVLEFVLTREWVEEINSKIQQRLERKLSECERLFAMYEKE